MLSGLKRRYAAASYTSRRAGQSSSRGQRCHCSSCHAVEDFSRVVAFGNFGADATNAMNSSVADRVNGAVATECIDKSNEKAEPLLGKVRTNATFLNASSLLKSS